MTSGEEVAAAVAAARNAAAGVGAEGQSVSSPPRGPASVKDNVAAGRQETGISREEQHTPGGTIQEEQLQEKEHGLKHHPVSKEAQGLTAAEFPVQQRQAEHPNDAALQGEYAEPHKAGPTSAHPELEVVPSAYVPATHGPQNKQALAPQPYPEADTAPPAAGAPPQKEDGFDPAAYARQAALGQLDRNKDGLITGDDLVGAAHEYAKLKRKVKRYRTCATIAAVLLIIVIGIWIGIAILAGRVTGGVKVVDGGFYVSRGNGRVVSTGRSLYAMPAPVATELLNLTPAQLETLEAVTFSIGGQPSEVHMKVAGLASRPNFVELRSAAGDRLTVVPGSQTYASASLLSAPATVTSAFTFAPVK